MGHCSKEKRKLKETKPKQYHKFHSSLKTFDLICFFMYNIKIYYSQMKNLSQFSAHKKNTRFVYQTNAPGQNIDNVETSQDQVTESTEELASPDKQFKDIAQNFIDNTNNVISSQNPSELSADNIKTQTTQLNSAASYEGTLSSNIRENIGRKNDAQLRRSSMPFRTTSLEGKNEEGKTGTITLHQGQPNFNEPPVSIVTLTEQDAEGNQTETIAMNSSDQGMILVENGVAKPATAEDMQAFQQKVSSYQEGGMREAQTSFLAKNEAEDRKGENIPSDDELQQMMVDARIK